MRIRSIYKVWFLFDFDAGIYNFELILGFDEPCFSWNEI